MSGPTDFAKFVPGFDFLQGLLKNAGRSMPDMGQWIAPTLDPEELGKRIEQLKTVQYWLEQNARMLGTTIQALEVQRMTLSTLKSMDMPLERMRDAFKMRPAGADEAAARAAANAAAKAAPQEAPAESARPSRPASSRRKPAPEAAAASPVADPMQWWNALTQQFTELAAHAIKETSAGVSRNLGGQAADATEGGKPPAAKARKKAPRRAPGSAAKG